MARVATSASPEMLAGDLRTLRVALTGAPRGPELWAVLAALPRDEALRRALPS